MQLAYSDVSWPCSGCTFAQTTALLNPPLPLLSPLLHPILPASSR